SGTGRHIAGNVTTARGKFRPERPAVLPEGGVSPVHRPGRLQLLPGRIVLDLEERSDFAEIDVGGLRDGASGKNEYARKDKMSHRFHNPDVMRAFPLPRGQAGRRPCRDRGNCRRTSETVDLILTA